ncbi:MAG: class A beta-lactamase-related serine hydrolase [Gemmataceae bacterium]|nr:class A beta-lactamase-related serine hydrolase [Gemmataceae bacterium]
MKYLLATIVGWNLLLGAARAGDNSALAAKLTGMISQHQGRVALVVQKFGEPVVISVKPDEPMPTASLIKFPIMIEAYNQFAEGKAKPGDVCVLNKDDKVPGAGILTDHFTPGATFSLRDAVRMMIVWSDNTATNIVLDNIGIRPVNARMEAMGLRNTKVNSKVYKRSSSSVDLARSEKFGLGSTSAGEMMQLLHLLHDGKLVSPAASKEMLSHMLKCEDPDKLPKYLPHATKIAMKTGSVSDAKTVAGIIWVPKAGTDPKKPEFHEVAVCILTADNKDQGYHPGNAGDELCAKMAKVIYDHFHEAR